MYNNFHFVLIFNKKNCRISQMYNCVAVSTYRWCNNVGLYVVSVSIINSKMVDLA